MTLTEDVPFKVLRRTWQPVALSRDLGENQVRGYTLLDQDMLVARFPGKLMASQAWCPHKGMRLENGTIAGGMRPKLAAAADALADGVTSAHVLNGMKPDTLLLEGFRREGCGTMIGR